MSTDALDILKKYRGIVWPKVQEYLINPPYPSQFSIPATYKPDAKFHSALISEYPLRQGKYLRPTLLVLAAQAMGERYQKVLPTAAAMQVSEEWLLIHDDIEDNSLQRRGKPTLHFMYTPELAINAGDALQVTMWGILLDNFKILSTNKSIKILSEFCTMLTRTALGQTVEIKWTQDNRIKFTDRDWFFIADGKTSYYTIAGPLRLGAILAGANPKQLSALADFGLLLGRCFQLTDDILDITSGFDGLKKQTGNDIYEGKRTILLGHLLRSTNHSDAKKLFAILKKTHDQKTPQEVVWVIDKMREYGSIDYAKTLAKQLKIQALSRFQTDLKFLSHQPYRQQLETLIDFVLNRDH